MGSTRIKMAAALAIPALFLTACGGQSETTTDPAASGGAAAASGEVRIDGSSTVAPLSAAAGELFTATPEGAGVNVTVGQSGTGGGFQKFCAGETDISDASRPIKEEEAASCADAGVEYAEITVANDALTVIVSKENDWATCLTVEELNKMWAPEAEGQITNWNQIRDGFPDVPLELFGAGTDSGTFDYFTDVINGEEGASRTDYNPSEDDNITVTGVEGTKGGLGYLGFSYFEENADKLIAVEVDGGNGCVAPSLQSASDGTYAPLSRPLFIYPSKAAMARPEVAAFVEF
ncbi:MAG TPA: PstS family phosphate ABC transporter substrate-binding protein [Candidatus Limnocylindrales bacterium]|nr:PstS family phosphate ABC transporter substrate-binding protein [Candidatus Limnocylindrales bacterium]